MDIDEIKNLIEILVEDLYCCLEYEPNKENDILCFMERYIKAPKNERPYIIGQLLNCINDKPYENPFKAYQFYDKNDIKMFENYIFSYLDNINETRLRLLIQNINTLNDKCRGQIIDCWRRERLIKLLELTSQDIDVYKIISEESLW